jgi:hypothetical protein
VFAWRALIDAHRGRFERARATLRPLVEEAARTEKAWWGAILLSVVGFVEFAAGEHAAADDALVRMRRLLDGIGIRDGLLDRTEPFHVESLVALGELARAREVLARLEDRGRMIPRLWIDVTLPRARALVLAAEDDTAAALGAIDELDVATAVRARVSVAPEGAPVSAAEAAACGGGGLSRGVDDLRARGRTDVGAAGARRAGARRPAAALARRADGDRAARGRARRGGDDQP